ncbi:MAG: dihydroorotate dehydrogenase electron transfer subunit [Bacteroidales bacterium]|nr:dihydroorotate dehydrogenase electron transfer subunit [Bacteroidales bacterium]
MNLQGKYKVIENRALNSRSMLMRLAGDTSVFSAPGQFVNVAVPGLTLRRPISVADYSDGELTLIYDIVGRGTKIMSEAREGFSFDLLTGLGNGFDTDVDSSHPLLLGGGVGCAPLLGLAKRLMEAGKHPAVVLGFNSSDRVIMPEMFGELGFETLVATVDGSVGVRGFVTDAIPLLSSAPDYFYACGPMPMLRALSTGLDIPGEVSLEARMGCGFGACVCCSLETTKGAKRICLEGPVFKKDELIWK